MSGRNLACATALAVVALGCGRSSEPNAEGAALVVTARVTSGPVTDWLRLYGRVAPPPDRDATLAPLVPGALVEVPVREGQAVKTGDVLARVDGALLGDALRAAEAAERRTVAEAEFRKRAALRTRALFEKGVSSGQEAEADEAAAVAADSAVAEAASAAATARRRSAYADLRAPFDGIVLRVLRRPGDVVDGTPTTPVVQLASLDGAQVAADATGEGLVRIEKGQTAEVGLKDGTSRLGHVLRVARAVDPASGSGEVRVAFEGASSPWPLGLGVEVRIAVKRKEGATVVPTRALRKGESGKTEVVVVENAKAVVREVQIGLHEGDVVEIVSGLSVGETVVVDDPVGLAEGTPVQEKP
jgi:RND family efflux transporter MFP subunit